MSLRFLECWVIKWRSQQNFILFMENTYKPDYKFVWTFLNKIRQYFEALNYWTTEKLKREKAFFMRNLQFSVRNTFYIRSSANEKCFPFCSIFRSGLVFPIQKIWNGWFCCWFVIVLNGLFESVRFLGHILKKKLLRIFRNYHKLKTNAKDKGNKLLA